MDEWFWKKSVEYAKAQQEIDEARLKLWHVKRTDHGGYDTYDSFVVAAPTEEDARYMHPGSETDLRHTKENFYGGEWVTVEQCHTLNVRQIGIADEDIKTTTVILASYNAG